MTEATKIRWRERTSRGFPTRWPGSLVRWLGPFERWLGLFERWRGLLERWRGLRAATARPFVLSLVLAFSGLALSACTGEQFQKGYIMPQGALEQIPIGASQDQVLIVMGTPSTVATLDGEVFYYISQRASRPVMFMETKVVDQRVVAIYFDKNRQVRRLANYGLQDGKIFDFISRTTATSGQELSYLTPLFKLLSFN